MAPRELPIDEGDTLDPGDWAADPAEGRRAEEAIYSAMPGRERKAVHEAVGNALSGQLAAALVREMIDARGMSLSQVKERFGFAPKVISEITNCKLKEGPKLATLISLGDALGFDVDIRLVDRADAAE